MFTFCLIHTADYNAEVFAEYRSWQWIFSYGFGSFNLLNKPFYGLWYSVELIGRRRWSFLESHFGGCFVTLSFWITYLQLLVISNANYSDLYSFWQVDLGYYSLLCWSCCLNLLQSVVCSCLRFRFQRFQLQLGRCRQVRAQGYTHQLVDN